MQSENINELLSALSKAQGNINGAKKDKSNPFYKSSYADLSSVWDACRKVLSENGLSVIQTMQNIEGTLTLITTLGHSSGQWIKSLLPIQPQKTDPQSLGLVITYMRRYALSSIVGVAPEEEDDDAEGSMDRESKYITQDQLKKLDLLLNGDKALREELLKGLEVSSLSQIKESRYNKVLAYVEKKKGVKNGNT